MGGGVISEPFLEKSMGYSTGYFLEIDQFFLNGHNSINLSQNWLKLST